jgi:hypothetical protein
VTNITVNGITLLGDVTAVLKKRGFNDIITGVIYNATATTIDVGFNDVPAGLYTLALLYNNMVD